MEKSTWDVWQQNIDQNLRKQFEQISKTFDHGPRPSAEVACTVTKTGKIENVRLILDSKDERVNYVVLQIVRSLEGQWLVQFPIDSASEAVEMDTSFSNHLWFDKIDDHI
jgi:hypothetical protein